MAGIKRKQSKNTYKIPRSLKQSIKQNLNKIVKRRERKLRDEEVSTSCLLTLFEQPLIDSFISRVKISALKLRTDCSRHTATALLWTT